MTYTFKVDYYYKKKLNEESAQEFMKKKIEDLGFDMDILRDRLTRIFKMAMDKLEEPKNYKIAGNSSGIGN